MEGYTAYKVAMKLIDKVEVPKQEKSVSDSQVFRIVDSPRPIDRLGLCSSPDVCCREMDAWCLLLAAAPGYGVALSSDGNPSMAYDVGEVLQWR